MAKPAVTAAAAPHGLHFAPDPSSQTVCTIGGNLAFNAGGAHCLKYGMTSNHVLGLKAVLATGEVVEFGGLSREQIGPDWTGLFVGNEGLFGIALEITVQLLPKPEKFHTVLAGYRTLEQAGYVERDPVGGRFRLGLGLIGLAGPLLADLDVRRLARPALERLVEATGETAALVLWDGHGAVVAEQVPSPHEVKHTAALGTRWVTCLSASVQAFVASMMTGSCVAMAG